MDIYDKEIMRLTKLVSEEKRCKAVPIIQAWGYGKEHSPLFDACGISRHTLCGCLTQVKSGSYPAQTRELQERIANDPRVPPTPYDITLDDLPVFAEYQRELDKMFNRRAPETFGGS